jgi:hypothetical protein
LVRLAAFTRVKGPCRRFWCRWRLSRMEPPHSCRNRPHERIDTVPALLGGADLIGQFDRVLLQTRLSKGVVLLFSVASFDHIPWCQSHPSSTICRYTASLFQGTYLHLKLQVWLCLSLNSHSVPNDATYKTFQNNVGTPYWRHYRLKLSKLGYKILHKVFEIIVNNVRGVKSKSKSTKLYRSGRGALTENTNIETTTADLKS